MTFDKFDEFQQKLFNECFRMGETKGREYAHSLDRFDNFNRLAKELSLDRKKILQVYFHKHLDAIYSYIKTEKEYSSESIKGRIVDAITYLTILAGMIEEDLQNKDEIEDLGLK